VKSVFVGVVAAAAVIAITGAASGSGVGAIFNLGQTNKVNATSALTGSTKHPMLSVTNSGPGTALSLQVKAGKAPFSVNSAVQVPKLNASLLGGLAASQFVQGAGQSRLAGFTMSSASVAEKKLLLLPGFGTFNVLCGPNGGGFADVDLMTGPHPMDRFVADIVSTAGASVGDSTLTPNANWAFANLAASGPSAVWERVILRYTTGSGGSLTTHLATLDIMANVTATTCDFDATAVTGVS
jgi:hypothetical protein